MRSSTVSRSGETSGKTGKRKSFRPSSPRVSTNRSQRWQPSSTTTIGAHAEPCARIASCIVIRSAGLISQLGRVLPVSGPRFSSCSRRFVNTPCEVSFSTCVQAACWRSSDAVNRRSARTNSGLSTAGSTGVLASRRGLARHTCASVGRPLTSSGSRHLCASLPGRGSHCPSGAGSLSVEATRLSARLTNVLGRLRNYTADPVPPFDPRQVALAKRPSRFRCPSDSV
jgi:hypothetical protein